MAHQETGQETSNIIKPEDEYYMRYILLLLRGGTLLLRAILEHVLQQKKIDLNQFLKLIKPEIQLARHLKQEQKDILYPATKDASIEDFDITLLAHLIIWHLSKDVDRNVFTYVEKLRDLRNNYAHATETKMDTFTFNIEWSNLVIVIQNGSTCISDKVKEEIKKIIDNINLKNQAMTEKILEEIKLLLKKEDFTEHIQMKFEDIENKLVRQIGNVQTTVTSTLKEVQEIKAIIKRKKKQGEEEIKINETIRGHAQINPPDAETKVKVLNLLAEACRILNTGSPPKDEVQENVDALCKDVEHTDVKLMNISSGSIVFEFQCCSLTAIVDLIDYFYSPIFQKRLDAIAEALEEVIGKTIYITADGINRQSLECMTLKIKEKNYENIMQFEMSCTGIDGLSHVMEVFEGGKAADSLNKLSKALSNAVGKPVTLHTSLDMDQMKTALQSIRNQLELKQSPNDRDEEILEDIAPVSGEEPTPTEERSSNKTFISTEMKEIYELQRKQEEQNSELQAEIKVLLHRKKTNKEELQLNPSLWNQWVQGYFKDKSQSEVTEELYRKKISEETEELYRKKINQNLKQAAEIEELYRKQIKQNLENQPDVEKLYRKKIKQDFKQTSETEALYRKQTSETEELYRKIKQNLRQASETEELYRKQMTQNLKQASEIEELFRKQINQKLEIHPDVEKLYREKMEQNMKEASETEKLYRKQNMKGVSETEELYRKQIEQNLKQIEKLYKLHVKHIDQNSELESKIEELLCELYWQQKNKMRLFHKTDIHIKLADEIISVTTGCDLLPPDRLLVVDSVNKNLKIVNIQTNTLVDRIDFHTLPFDIAVLPNNQTAVTLPEEKAILILSTTEKLAKTDSWKVKAKPWGITHQTEEVYVLCCNDLYGLLSVIILNLSGEHLREISVKTKDGDSFGCRGHIALSKDVQHLYINDCLKNCILKVALKGDETVEKSNINLQQPEGLAVLHDGSLLLCNNDSGVIHHMSADMKELSTIPEHSCKATFIFYHPDNQEVYFGCANEPTIKVFNLKYNHQSV